MAVFPGAEETDPVFRFVSQLQRSIAVSMAQPCRKAIVGISHAVDGLPESLAPLETRVIRGVLLETLVRLPRLGAVTPGPTYHKYLQEVASVDYRSLAETFRRACHALPVTSDADLSDTKAGQTDPRVRMFLERIHADPGHRHRLTSFASEMGLSRWHMEHLIKAETGLTFTAHVRLARMQRAAERLRSPVPRIKEVAADLGYARQSDFSRDFRRIHGVGPRSWRRRGGDA